ncbi:hypothetical protein [Lentisalinibacter sediminis]|uniref:hypothetical protein n=1 Tax=Lentisalinibacter sediminis TaxID=2992237 RepID=UPI0038687804
MRFLIGIDDTDNLESRGTGFRARLLGASLAEAGLARTDGVSRHQLLVHPDIPYTSHNSSLCLDADVLRGRLDDVVEFCRDFLLRESAEGSDAGLCIAAFDSLDEDVQTFGRLAKERVLDQDEAVAVARRAEVFLQGLTGDHGGIIGALAGVGLRRSGRDGRFVWLEGVRELSGVARAADLLRDTGIDAIEDRQGTPVPADDVICVDPWPRALLIDERAVLLVEKAEKNDVGFDWQLLPREEIRRY